MTRRNTAWRGESLPGEQHAYIVRDAGTPGRPGKVHQIYPYTLKALLEAMEDARFRSFAGPPQEVVKVDGQERTVFRRYEGGQETAV